jgi:hypothetical protein
MSEITIRWSSAGEEPGLLRLLQRTYERWPRVETGAAPLDHLRWKYEDIGVQHGRHTIALDGERVVGAIPLSVRTFLIDGRAMQAATAWDVAVDPDYQGFGLYMKMQDVARPTYRNSLDFNFGYAAPHPAMARGRERMETWQVMAARIDVLAGHATRTRPDSDSGVTIDAVAGADKSIDALSNEALAPFRLAGLRDHRYLNWRYADPRGGGGTLLLARTDGAPAGLAALRISNGTAYLADLLVPPGREDVARALTAEALARAADAGIERARCWLPERHSYRTAVMAAGISRVKEQRAFTYQVLQAPEATLAFLEDPEAPVHVTIADTDHI